MEFLTEQLELVLAIVAVLVIVLLGTVVGVRRRRSSQAEAPRATAAEPTAGDEAARDTDIVRDAPTAPETPAAQDAETATDQPGPPAAGGEPVREATAQA